MREPTLPGQRLHGSTRSQRPTDVDEQQPLVEIPDSTEGLANLGYLYRDLEDFEPAERLYRRAYIAQTTVGVLDNRSAIRALIKQW